MKFPLFVTPSGAVLFKMGAPNGFALFVIKMFCDPIMRTFPLFPMNEHELVNAKGALAGIIAFATGRVCVQLGVTGVVVPILPARRRGLKRLLEWNMVN